MADNERARSAPGELDVTAAASGADAPAHDEASQAATPPRDPEAEAKEEERRRNNASAAALTLEIVGDLPHAEIKPPENILFVCKLNPVTRSDDLELIFSRFGKINSCEVIRDKKYAFVEYDDREAAERMQNVLIDDRRIWVDFSQSVSKLHNVWVKQRMGRGAAPSPGPPSRRAEHESRGNRAPHRPAPLTHPDMHTENVLVDLDVLRDDPRMHGSRREGRHEDRRSYDRRRDRPRYDHHDRRSDEGRRDRHDDRYRRDRNDDDRSRRERHERERYARHRDDRYSDRVRYDDRPRSSHYEARGKDRARSRSP
ncbi:hypothetical protein CBS9595_003799 [Malassezia furfur]|nr:hypothetical protein CBS9595_003799 [Malassezia furfur]